MANPNRKKRTKEEWDKLTEQAAKNAAKRMQEKATAEQEEKAKKLTEGRARYNAAQEKNPSKTVTAAQAKEAARDPTSAGAKAVREKVFSDMKKQKEAQAQAAFRESYNAPLAQMSRNSTSWSMLGQAKDAAQKAKWPEKAIGKMTAKQDALHQKNVEIAKPYDITFDAEKGVWRGGDSYGEWKGAQVYDAQKALPLPGSTASDMAAGARNVRETAGRFQPNRAVSAAQAAENRAKSAQRAKDTLMWPVHQTMAAIGGVTGSLYDTANMALETTGIDKFLPDAVKNWVTKNAQLGHGVQEQVRAVNYERGGKIGGAAGDLAQLGVEMLGQYALAAATGGASAGAQLGAKTGTVGKALETIAKSPNFWYSFVRTAGPEYEEAKANGASGPQAATAAILSALGQAGVEMGGGVETLAGKAAGAGGVKGAVKSMLEEGGEEVTQDFISGLAHKGVYDQGRGWFGSGDSGAVVNPQRMAGEFAMGALGASLPVGVNALMNIGKKPAQGLPLPQDGAKAGSNPADANPQGLPTEISYEAQIDGVFNGSLSKAKPVTIGKTPEILQSLGAPNLPLTMTQNTARKIAYPEGYLGGKHNLGIPALKSLPQQLNNPLAVLQSKTQPDSFVVLTEWNDTNGNPVVAAVHMNKRGVIEDVNALASAYGKRNLESLLGKNRENVIYTKENKSIDQLLSIGLQLPEAMADDTLVAYSIAQNEGKNKGNPQGLPLPTSFPETSAGAAGRNIGLPTSFPETAKTQTVGLPLPTSFPETGTAAQGLPLPKDSKPKTLNEHIRENSGLFEKNGTLFEMSGDEFAQSDKKLIDQVTEFFNSLGNKIFRKGFGEVTLTRSGARDSISHGTGREKAIAFAAVPDVIQKGQVIDEQHNWKGRRYDTVTFGGRVKIAGQDYDMGVIVKRYNTPDMASKYYVHEVLMTNKEGEATTFKTGTRPDQPVGYPSDVTSPSDQSMPQAGAEVKGQAQGIPDPGILRQTPWQEGETKPQLGGEHETRPETVRRLTQEEEYEIGKQLDDWLEQQEAEEAARRQAENAEQAQGQLDALTSDSYQIPDIIRQEESAVRQGQSPGGALGGRLAEGTRAERYADTTEENPTRAGTREIPETPDAERAQGQLDALASDSYRGPEAEGRERMTLGQSPGGALGGHPGAAIWPERNVETTGENPTRAGTQIETATEQMAEQARARGERIAANHPVKRATVRAEASPMDAHAPDAEAAIQTVNGLEGMRQALKRLERQFKLSGADLVTAKELSQGRRPAREVDAGKLEKIETYAKLLREYDSAMQPFHDYRKQLETARQEAADALLQDADNWKDVKLGASLSANTAERVFETVAGKDGARLIDALARPVHEHEAQRVRWENGYRDRLRGMMKGTTREESHYTAMKNYAEYLERAGMDGSKLRTAMNDYLQKNRKKIDMGRVEALENALISLTQEMHPEVNETRIRNGYTPLEYTSRYLPALHRADEGGAAARVLRKMFGIETRADALPTEIAGTTAGRRPGQPWQPFAMERTGDTGKWNPKDFDAVRAVDEYITQAGREIFFTDDIQNWRTFEERLRYRFSDEGTRAELDSIQTDPNLDAEQKLAEKTKLWERDQYSLPHFPTWLRKYADTLAGKKQLIDRAAEDELSRGFYRTVNDIETKTAVNLTGFNISTALSNFIAMQQGGAELSAPAMARAALDYAGELAGDTSFRDRSTFLTNRKGTERVYKTGLQNVQDIGGKPAQWADDFTSGILTRARYYDNIRRGMADAQAMQDADGWAARVMGDRSTSARPLIFESKNPLVKVVTMFQLEPANNFAHWFHDLPLEKGAAGAAAVLAKLFLSAYLFNDGVEKMTGNRPAPDAIGMVNDFVGRVAGWRLPNTIDLVMDAARGGLDEEDFKAEKASPADAALETMQDVGSQLPFISGPVGAAFGAGSTRFPIESAVPDVTKMIKAGLGEGTAESKRAAVAKELAKPFLTIGMPTGGSQLSKTVRGVKTMLEGGAYGYDSEGNKTLKFPAYSGETTDAGKAARFAQAAIFGPYALKSAREYVDSGYKGLSAKGTKAYQTLTGKYGVDQKTAADAVRAVASAKAPEDGSRTAVQAKREAIMGLDLGWEEKAELSSALAGGDDMVSYQDWDSFHITNTVAARNQPAAFALMREQGMDAAQAKKYAELVDEQGATYTWGADGHAEKDSKAVRLKKAYETIQTDESLTEEQKNGVVRAVVLPELGKKYVGEYAEKFIGGIGVEQLIDAQAAYEDISEDVKKDTTIHENNRSEYVRLRFADYLENTGLDFLRRESLWYFQSHDESEFKEPWSEIIRKTTPSDEEERTRKQSALRGLQDSGMDESLFKVIKAGMGRVYADKDANGETIDGSAKKKKIAYLNKWEGLTDEQKNLIMKACGYKYGMGEKPKKGKSSSSKFPYALPTSFQLPKMKSLLPF